MDIFIRHQKEEDAFIMGAINGHNKSPSGQLGIDHPVGTEPEKGAIIWRFLKGVLQNCR